MQKIASDVLSSLPVSGEPIILAISSQASGFKSARLYIWQVVSQNSGLVLTSSIILNSDFLVQTALFLGDIVTTLIK